MKYFIIEISKPSEGFCGLKKELEKYLGNESNSSDFESNISALIPILRRVIAEN